jgi:hypothetical protein
MDPDVVIVLAGLNQKNPFSWILSQTLGKHAARAARADDDEVVGVLMTCCTHVSTFIDTYF